MPTDQQQHPLQPPQRQRRRKVTLACEPCRQRKARCDGGKPICSTCQRRFLGVQHCIYKTTNARTECSDDYTRSLLDRIRQLEQAAAAKNEGHGTTPDVSPPKQQRSFTGDFSLSEDTSASVLLSPQGSSRDQCNADSTAPIDPLQMDAPPNGGEVTAMGTMLSDAVLSTSSRGSQDFYGGSSVVSFLKEAYGPIGLPVSRQPAQPGEPQTRDVLSAYANLENFPLPPRPVADHLVQKYFERVYYLYPFFDRDAFESAYQTLWQPATETGCDPKQYHGLGLGSYPGGDASTIVFHCALNAIFALGVTFSDLPAREKPGAIAVFYKRSKSHVGIDLLDLNNIGVVQALLLIALALQGTPFPTRCWNAVGVACRVAQGLGLHTEASSQPGESREKQIRRRTWYGCVTMDLLVSMTFGRPNMTTNLPVLPPTSFDDNIDSTCPEFEQLRDRYSIESIRLCRILENILSKVYKPWLRQTPANNAPSSRPGIHHSLDIIVELHTELAEFEKSLPSSLSWKSPTSFETFPVKERLILETQRNVLNARFLYLQLMLHRPILTHLLSADEPGGNAARNEGSVSKKTPDKSLLSSFIVECAKSCIDAAIQLIDLINGTYLSETSDVWWWNGLYACTAGLVLIVSRLSPLLWKSLSEEEVESSWNQCQTILKNLGSCSTPGRKSMDLLIRISELVIAKQAAHEKSGNLQAPGGSIVLPGSQNEQWPFMGAAGQNLPLGIGIPRDENDQMDIFGTFFSSWDQTIEFMPADIY